MMTQRKCQPNVLACLSFGNTGTEVGVLGWDSPHLTSIN